MFRLVVRRTAVVCLATVATLALSEPFARWVENVRYDRLRAALPSVEDRSQKTASSTGEMAIFAPRENGLGYRLRPNVRVSGVAGTESYSYYTNALGMPWRETEIEKPPWVTRIAFVGDSFTQGSFARDYTSGFVGIVDGILGSTQVEVLNFGVGGFGLHDIYEEVVQEVLRFEPDLIVLCSFNGNDFRDTFLGFGEVAFDEQGRIVPPATKSPEKLRAEAASSEEFGSFLYYTYWMQRSYPEIARDAVGAAHDYLGRIWKVAHDRGISLAVVTIPFREQVEATSPSSETYDIGRPQSLVRQWTQSRDVPYLDLLPTFRSIPLSERERLYVPGDSHWTTRGHLIAGRAIGTFLEGMLNLESPSRHGESLLNRVLNRSALARMARTVYLGAVGPQN